MDMSNGNLSSLLNLAFRVARREGLCVADAEDVSSATILRYLEVSAEVVHPSAWIFLVARRNAWAFRRKRVVRDKHEEEQLRVFGGMQCLEAESIENQLDLKAALGALSATERATVLWRDLRGESLEIIAKNTGLSLKTVKRRLKRGRVLLQRSLAGRSVRSSMGRSAEPGRLCVGA